MIFLSLLAFPSLQYHAHLFSRTEIVFTFCQVTVDREKETKAMAWCEFVFFFKKKNSFLRNIVQGVLHFSSFSTTVYVSGGEVIRTHARTAHRHASPQEGGGEKGLSSLHFFFRGSFSSYFLSLPLLLSPAYIHTPPFSPHNPNP